MSNPTDPTLAYLARIADALEGLLARQTPADERDRAAQVDSYVRSENNGGALVYLYGLHPGLKYKVATIYSEHFPALRAFMDPEHGPLWDGEAPPSRETAARKRLLQLPGLRLRDRRQLIKHLHRQLLFRPLRRQRRIQPLDL